MEKGRTRRYIDRGLSRGLFLSRVLIGVQAYRTSFFRKEEILYHLLSFSVFP